MGTQEPLVGQDAVRDFYAEAGPLTSPGRHRARIDGLPSDVTDLARVIQGLLIYDVVAADFYGIELSDAQRADIHIRRLDEILDRLTTTDGRPLDEARPAENRVAGRCRDFTLLASSLLRGKGIPARARCGFAAYLNPGRYEDHQVCEYWNPRRRRWQLLDAQLDDIWIDRLGIHIDPHDVPRDQFLTAADAWQRCRRGIAEAEKFGISFANLRGLWFIAGSLVRDLAALNKMEMLPWDSWGAQPSPDEHLDADQLALFDELAALTRDPDTTFDELRTRYQQQDELRVSDTVYNTLLERTEAAT